MKKKIDNIKMTYLSMSPSESFKVPKYPKKPATPTAPNQPGNSGTYELTVHPVKVPMITMPTREFSILKLTDPFSSGWYTCFQGFSVGGNCFLEERREAALAYRQGGRKMVCS